MMQKKDVTLVLVALLLLAGLYLLMPQKPNHSGSASHSSAKNVPQDAAEYAPPPDWRSIEKNIGIQMKLGRQSEELRRELIAVENKMTAPKIDPATIDVRAYDPNEPIPLTSSSEGDAARVYRETVEDKNRDRGLTPDQRLTNKINRDQWEREYRDAYEREYIRQYIENARKAGYAVRLNDKGEIVDVTAIGRDEAVRFPQSVDQSGEKATMNSDQ